MNEGGKNRKNHWGAGLAAGVLLLLGAPFRFFMRGYSFLAYAIWAAGLFLLMYWMLPRKGRPYLLALLFIAAAVFAVFEVPVIRNCGGTERNKGDTDPVDYIVVLGAGLTGTQPTQNLLWRLETAADFARKHPEAVIVCSGGQGADEIIAEGRAMVNWLQNCGIEAERLLAEEASASTRENLLYSYRLIKECEQMKEEKSTASAQNVNPPPEGIPKDPRIVIISSEYHMHRITKLLQMLQIKNATALPAKTRLPFLRVSMFIREAAAGAHEWVLGE